MFSKILTLGSAILLFPVLLSSSQALAWELDALWLNSNQLGQQAFNENRYQDAVNSFQDSSWRAAANYRQGNFEAALTDLAERKDIDSLYNRANALAQLYRLPEAIDVYRQVLDMDPDYTAAAINLELVAALLASMTDDPGAEFDVDREEGEASDTPPPEDQEEITAATNGQENEENQEDTSERLSSQESQDADGNTGTSQLEDPQSAEEQQFSAALEQELTLQQWLGRIKDDPAALLRNKFEKQKQMDDALRINLLNESNQQLW